ncbi:MAG: hypothetical protein M1839_006040 [Geoglossum umbratile]|nr:MAG: hypothetical protein M1839_006040 [Geoglossum umbratile]
MHFSAIPALLTVALTITTTHAVSLIDALNAAGATRFATFIQSDPTILAAYTSPATRTVFAPTDPYFIQPLSRRATNPEKNALYQATNQETDLQSLGFVPAGSVVTTELTSNQLNGANQASVSRKVSAGNSTSKRQVGTGVTMASGLGGSVSILEGDISYDGGLIHTVNGIDSSFDERMFTLPEPISTTLTTAGLSLFNNLLVEAGLSSTLDGSSSVTVFVPSNAALAAASGAGGSAFLQGHIIPSFVGYLPLLTNGAVFTTQSGTTLKISITNGQFYVNGIQIITPNNIVGNGVVHVIDGVSLIGTIRGIVS